MHRFKPGVNRSVHLCLAALLWTSIGLLLLVRGLGWIGPGVNRVFVVLALGIGTLKSRFVLDRNVRRSIGRIKQFDDVTCIGAVYSWKTWVLVSLMMAFGIILRKLTDPGVVVGILYMAIGWALLFSSRLGWIAWWQWGKHDRVS